MLFRGAFVLSPLLTALLVVGCGVPERADDNRVEEPRVHAPAMGNRIVPPPAPRAITPDRGEAITVKDPGFSFTYTWPAAAAAIPQLDRWLRGNAQALRRRGAKSAQADIEAASKSGFDMIEHSYEERWGVVADGPQLLILQSAGYSFTGGAHGMPVVTTLFWDKAGARRLALGDLFDVGHLLPAIRGDFCAALDAERARRRGTQIERQQDGFDAFVDCVPLANQTILPVARADGALDRLRVVIMPYEAGPYAEGIYQIDLPVTAPLLEAIRPAWRDAFSVAP